MFQFFVKYPECLGQLVLLGTLGAAGQVVVFWLVKLFRQHIVPFIITTRKLVTTLISVFIFHHGITSVQLLGVAITFLIVLYDFKKEISHQKSIDSSTVGSGSFKEEVELNTLMSEESWEVNPIE